MWDLILVQDMKTIVFLLSNVDPDLTCDSDSLSPCLVIVIISRIQEVWHRVVSNNRMVNARKTYHSLLIPIVSLFTQWCVALILIPESLFLPLFHTNVKVPYPALSFDGHRERNIICSIKKGRTVGVHLLIGIGFNILKYLITNHIMDCVGDIMDKGRDLCWVNRRVRNGDNC